MWLQLPNEKISVDIMMDPDKDKKEIEKKVKKPLKLHLLTWSADQPARRSIALYTKAPCKKQIPKANWIHLPINI